MPDDDARDPIDPDPLYRNYLVTCRRLGVEPVLRERAQQLVAEWSEAIAAGRAAPPIHTLALAPRSEALRYLPLS